jgi:hypothetical protein
LGTAGRGGERQGRYRAQLHHRQQQANLLEGNQNADMIIGLDGISGNDVIISHNFGGDFCTFDPGDSVSR